MILTCPSCETRYLLNTAVLGAEGRRVRCSKCAHIWHQAPEKTEEAGESPGVDAPPIEIEMRDKQEEPAATMEAVEVEPVPESVKPIPEGSALPALPAEAPLSLRYFGISFAGVFATILLVLLVSRSTLVGAWEPSAGLYDAIGLDAPVRGAGLTFENLAAFEHETRDGKLLVVEGRIVNISEEDRPIPPLSVTLLGTDGVLMEKVLESKEERILKAGESTKFQTRVTNPAPGSLSVRLSAVP